MMKFLLMIVTAIVVTTVWTPDADAAPGDIINLVHEFDGDSDGVTSFGMIELFQTGSGVDFKITANTDSLLGGDIHELYLNLPDAIDINSLVISNSWGISNRTINDFKIIVSPPIIGGAGSSFDMGINFGNGGGPPGNGVLTTASFSLTSTDQLLVGDFLFETSTPNNVPPVFAAVHFQDADVFGNGSETVGGTVSMPEPTSMYLLGLAGLLLLFRREK
jgi:hypothetical protein